MRQQRWCASYRASWRWAAWKQYVFQCESTASLSRSAPGRSASLRFVHRWEGVALALVSALSASGQTTFSCELPDGGRVSRIVEGRDATHETYPWQVALLGRTAPNRVSLLCGGSLIAADWVLTAAHCVTEKGSPQSRPVNGFEIRHGTTFWKERDGAARRGVAEIHTHPEWDGYVANGNDLALLRLSSPIDSEKSYASLLVSQSGASAFVFPGACAIVTGWGMTEARDSSSLSDQMQAANLLIIGSRECKQVWEARPPDPGKPPFTISDGEICAGLPGGVRGPDTCRGDSGGPLVVEGLRKGHYVLAGATSYGAVDCGNGDPGVYARVSHYMPWIRRTVAGE